MLTRHQITTKVGASKKLDATHSSQLISWLSQIYGFRNFYSIGMIYHAAKNIPGWNAQMAHNAYLACSH